MYNIKKAEESDLAGLYELECACFDDPWSAEFLFEDIVINKNAYFLCVWKDVPVGYCGVHIVLDEACITNICVHPDFRGKGAGKFMMDVMMKHAVQMGAVAMTLEVRVSNASAISMYEKEGFEKVGVRKRYYADKEDALIMWNYDIKSRFY